MSRIESWLFLPTHSTLLLIISIIILCQFDWDPYLVCPISSSSFIHCPYLFLVWNIWRRNATNYVNNCDISHMSLVPNFHSPACTFCVKITEPRPGDVNAARPAVPREIWSVAARYRDQRPGHFVTLELLVKICRGMQRVSSCMDLILWEF